MHESSKDRHRGASTREVPTLDVIIVNWNSGSQLSACLKSIAEYGEDVVTSVIVVDNNSEDGSLDEIGDIRLPLTVVRNPNNRGFAVACNQGAALGASSVVLFLNPDTRLFEGALSRSVEFLMLPENENVGICGVQLIDETGKVARSCARFPTLWGLLAEAVGLSRVGPMKHLGVHMRDWAHGETRMVDHVIGAFYLIKRHVYERLGGFDERFFVYLEDLDLSYRAYLCGMQSVYFAGVQVFHAGGGTSRSVKQLRLFYSLRSRLLYGFKHLSRPGALSLLAVTFLIEPWSRLAVAVATGRFADAKHTAAAYWSLALSLPRLIMESRG